MNKLELIEIKLEIGFWAFLIVANVMISQMFFFYITRNKFFFLFIGLLNFLFALLTFLERMTLKKTHSKGGKRK